MLSDQVKKLIAGEQDRQQGRFIRGIGLDDYFAKLGDKAELLVHYDAGICKGLAAYYCNDAASCTAFVSLLLVDPASRRTGLGKMLFATVLEIIRRRCFERCRLAVDKENRAALRFYDGFGFSIIDEKAGQHILELELQPSCKARPPLQRIWNIS